MAKPTTNKQKSWYRVTAAANGSPAEIYIYDVIVNYAWDDDEVTAKGFIDDLKAIGSDTPLDLHIKGLPNLAIGACIGTCFRRNVVDAEAASQTP